MWPVQFPYIETRFNLFCNANLPIYGRRCIVNSRETFNRSSSIPFPPHKTTTASRKMSLNATDNRYKLWNENSFIYFFLFFSFFLFFFFLFPCRIREFLFFPSFYVSVTRARLLNRVPQIKHENNRAKFCWLFLQAEGNLCFTKLRYSQSVETLNTWIQFVFDRRCSIMFIPFVQSEYNYSVKIVFFVSLFFFTFSMFFGFSFNHFSVQRCLPAHLWEMFHWN